MKRILAALSIALFAAPALATPFEQTQFDRGINVQAQGASAGSSANSGSVWAQDHSFIAPAQ